MDTLQSRNAAIASAAIDNYVLLEQIGEGGYGVVYKAEQISTGQMVAIKMLKFQDLNDEQRRNYQIIRFERETQLCAEINHPNIVKLLDKGYTADQEPYAVFEFVSGETLKDVIAANEGLSALETQALMGQVLDALSCAHAKGIVHRDLKPHNIMVTRTGSKSHIKILDFGIGAFTQEFRGNDYQSLTLTREVMGTPAYSAPEQLRGEPPTVKSDLYAWGLILLECLTGQPVMKGESVAEVFQQQLRSANVPLPPAIAGHPLADLLRRVLHKNPRQRVGDAAAILDDFSGVNFSSLVGKIETGGMDTLAGAEMTVVNEMAWQEARSERRQITVLCVKLSMVISDASALDLETIDTIQKDQLNLCKDTAVRFGGHIAGELGDNLKVYFGYPQVSDNDARRAGRTALELMSEVRKRSALLSAQHGIRLQARMGVHSGVVLSKPNHTPTGLVPNIAFNLLYNAPAGTILASDATKKLLDPYLEFEASQAGQVTDVTLPAGAFRVTGERQTEALSFLRPWSANREMIGRDTERDQVLNHWAVAQGGRGQALVLHGQAGIGKSKMVYEVKKQVRSDGFLFRECRCLPEHQNNALFPFLDMLRNHWGIAEMNDPAQMIARLEAVLAEAGVDLQEGLPILCAWLSIPLGEGYAVSQATPDVQKQILFKLLQQSILHIGHERAFLLVLEDLHWLDPTGQEFVEFLLGEMEDASFLLLMTTRPAFVPEWKQDYLLNVHLQPLTENATENLVEGVLDGKSVEEKALTYINERADGIPLYIEELTRMLVEENYLIVKEAVYQLNEEIDVQDIPMTLQDLLNARLDRLGQARESAQIAATIGREFNYELLVRASLRDEASVQSDLDALMDADLVIRQRRVQDESYLFRHALIRDAAYEGMLSGARKGHHLRIAETLRAEFPGIINDNPFQLAQHFGGAMEFHEACQYGKKATSRSVELNLYTECINQSNIAISWAKKIESHSDSINTEFELHQDKVQALVAVRGFGHEDVKLANERTGQLLLELPDASEGLISHQYQQIQFHLMSADYTKYEQLWEKAHKDALELQSKPFLAVLYASNGYKCHMLGDHTKSIEMSQKGIQLYDELKGEGTSRKFGLDFKAYALLTMAQCNAFLGDIEKSEALAAQGIQLCEELEDGHTKAFALAMYISLCFYLQDRTKIREIYDEHIKYLKDHNFTTFTYLFEELIGFCTGDADHSKTNYDLMIGTGIKVPETYYGIVAAQTAYEVGKYHFALSFIEKLLQIGYGSGEMYQVPDLLSLKAKCLFKLDPGRQSEMEDLFRIAIELAKSQKSILCEVKTLLDWKSLVNPEEGAGPNEQNKFNAIKEIFQGLPGAKMALEDQLRISHVV